MIRTRYAPSPTGDPHIGNIRTALFEYLFAKANGGDFLLRIEDTDRERYVEGGVERIIDSLKWLNIIPSNIDNFPTQSERLEVYKKHAFDLVRAGKAYICTCSKEKLAEDHERQISEGKPPRYEGHCREKFQVTSNKIQIKPNCSNSNAQKELESICRTADFSLADLKEGCYTIRMKMPDDRKIIVDDLIRGKVEFDTSLLDDQIILKSDGFPTYHLAVVIDDAEMDITHVIRGEEWLPSTPKHLILAEYFGFEPVKYAHLPVILGPDKKKLSKRHGAMSLMGYKELGYLPEAIINFLALLGWNPKDEREEFTLTELEKEFKLENVNKSPAVFDIEKLNHINANKLKNLRTEELKNRLKDLETEELKDITDGEVSLIQRGGYSTLKEAAEYILSLRREPEYDASILVFKKSSKPSTLKGLEETRNKLQGTNKFETDNIQTLLSEVVSENALTNGDVFWPVRVALSGEEKSPSPVELAIALGREKTIARIDRAIEKLKNREIK